MPQVLRLVPYSVLETVYIFAIPFTQPNFEGYHHFSLSLSFLSPAFLIYLIYRSALRQDGLVIKIMDILLPQIPTIIRIAGIHPPGSHTSKFQHTPIDSRNVNKLESIGTLMNFKGEPNACIYFCPKNETH